MSGTEGQGPMTLGNPTGWHHVPSLRADWDWSQERGRKEEEAETFLQDGGKGVGIVTFWSPGASGQPCQAAGQQTCASLQCEALKLWHLRQARCQVPGRAPRTTFSKSQSTPKVGEAGGRNEKGGKEAPRGTSLK